MSRRESIESLERRNAAIKMARDNKVKKSELKKQRMIEAAQAKVDQKTAELLEKAKKKEQEAKEKAEQERLKQATEEESTVDEMDEVEKAITDM